MRWHGARSFAVVVCAVMALGWTALSGCGGGGSSPQSGSVTVSLADAPSRAVSTVNVTIDRVEINVGDGWQPVTTQAQTYNVLTLAQTDAALGTVSLPPGTYHQIRIFPSQVTFTDQNGTHDVTVPSGAQTGIKLNIDFEVQSGQDTGLVLDFDVSKSIVPTGGGKYLLNPVIKVAVKGLAGSVTGTVTDGANPVQGMRVAAFDSNGVEANAGVTADDGTFKIWCLVPGAYTLKLAAEAAPDTVLLTQADVVVAAGQNTAVGTLTVTP